MVLPRRRHGYGAVATSVWPWRRAAFGCRDPLAAVGAAVKSPGTARPEICRLRLAPASGISATWSCGRVAEGGGLLNRYRVVKPYRGFESLRLRHPSLCPSSGRPPEARQGEGCLPKLHRSAGRL